MQSFNGSPECAQRNGKLTLVSKRTCALVIYPMDGSTREKVRLFWFDRLFSKKRWNQTTQGNVD
jgi:hypothetical protein